MTSTKQLSIFADATYGALFDILPNIFQHALPSYDTLSYIPLPSPHCAPPNISHVCRLWRQISLATPQLWSTLRFDVEDCTTTWNGVALRSADRWGWEIATAQRVSVEKDYHEARYERKKRSLERKLEWIELWLTRSGEVPLDLCVSIPEFQDLQRLGLDEYVDVARNVKALLRKLIDQRRRWRDVKIDVHMSMLLESAETETCSQSQSSPSLEDMLFSSYSANVDAFPCIPAIKLSLDNLYSAQHLSIRFYAVSPYRDAQLPIGVYLDVTNSSKLKSVEFRGPWPRVRLANAECVLNTGSMLGGCLPMLRRVEIASGYQFTFEQLIAFLCSSSGSLEEFISVIPYSIDSSSTASSELKRDVAIMLPKLLKLALTPTFGMQLSGTQIACELLHTITAPKVETLQFALPQRQEDALEVGKAVLGFLERTRESGTCAETNLDERIGVKSLKLTGTLCGGWIVKALPALPSMRALELNVSYESEEAVHALLTALSSTLNSSSPICPSLEQISINNATLCEDTVAAFMGVRTSLLPATLRCATFKQCRFVPPHPGGAGFGRGRGSGDGMSLFLAREEVKVSIERGLKVVFA